MSKSKKTKRSTVTIRKIVFERIMDSEIALGMIPDRLRISAILLRASTIETPVRVPGHPDNAGGTQTQVSVSQPI